jgi:homocysteine S-methyltransferase
VRLTEALKGPRVLLGDGANGSVLYSKGFTQQPCDLANLRAPELVFQVHRDYFDAGCDFVETNTFTANRFRLVGHEVDVRELNQAAARLARRAAGKERLVLGAIGPAGKPIEPIGTIGRDEIVESAREQAEALEAGGVDAFILETFIDLDELEAAVEGVRKASNLPLLLSKAFIEDGDAIASGLPTRCAEFMSKLGAAAIGANCIVGPQRMLDLIRMMGEGTDAPLLAIPTPGMPQLIRGTTAYDTTPEYFAKACMRLAEEGAQIIAGCCGSTPEHMAALRKLLDEGPVKIRPRAAVQAVREERAPLEETTPTKLLQKVRQREFVVAVEMDVPRGLKLNRFFDSIRAAKRAGTTVMNVSDGARARLRVNPMAMCHRIQTDVGIEAVMHFSCRDRNLLAIQADLLGCHALGVRNILAVTGDPANIGDYPSATSVFDVDSIGLVRILSRLNEGYDLAGYSVGVRCGFTICVAFNPMAIDLSLEADRLRQKAEAGAHIVYTQPVFDPCHADEAVEACSRLGLPVFVGVMPLRSARHAEFMHNEVPGITVPDWLRRRLAEAQSDEVALAIGIEEARTLAERIRKEASGLYVMPPANNVDVVEQLIGAAR